MSVKLAICSKLTLKTPERGSFSQTYFTQIFIVPIVSVHPLSFVLGGGGGGGGGEPPTKELLGKRE